MEVEGKHGGDHKPWGQSYTWLALPSPLGVSLSSPWHRTPSQFILDLSIPDHFSISSFCIHSFFTFLTPKLDPSVSDSFLGPYPPSTQRQSCGFALRISLSLALSLGVPVWYWQSVEMKMKGNDEHGTVDSIAALSRLSNTLPSGITTERIVQKQGVAWVWALIFTGCDTCRKLAYSFFFF